MSFTTSKAVGETFAIAMNPGVAVTVTWADGSQESFVSDGTLQTLTLASQKFTLDTDAAVSSLYVADNKIEAMDLTGIANSLKKLYCGNNELSTLNLSNFKNLNEVDLQGNNLTMLKVYGPESVNGASNQLTMFAVSQFARVKQLFLADNQLKGLGTTQMTSLENLFVQRNAIKSLKLNKCPSLKIASLADNGTTTLDVTGNSQLQELWAGGNAISKLDITSCGQLETLIAPGSQMTTVLWDEACKKTLTYLDLRDNNLYFNSFPTVSNNKVLTTALLAPQNPYPLVEEGYVYANVENNWSSAKLQPMATNGWGGASNPLLTITDSEGNTLKQGSDAASSDYYNHLRRITFWDSTIGKTVTISATSNYYPDITLTTTPFVVTTPTGIKDATLDNNGKSTEVYYNLNGQRVDKPTHGIYIANGKKVIIR
ncbi:MAG TPA: hypothetical protein DD401_05085 [Prevotella sp.]|nr:hypothetical protein [Prevotella sp.]